MHTEANYQNHPSELYNGNPLTETLQFHLDSKSLTNAITRSNKLSSNFHEIPNIYQEAEIDSLRNFYCPLSETWAIYRKVCSFILNGYVYKNPFSPQSIKLIAELSKNVKERNEFGFVSTTTAPSSLAVGPSGSGKTTAIRSILGATPQVIHHSNFRGRPFNATQLVWISFDLPSTNSPKALALNFFKAVDLALGTTYNEEWSSRKHLSVDAHLNEIQLIAAAHYIGIVHIDEIQFMTDYSKSDNSPSLKTIEALFNKIGVPVLLSSTEQGISLFEATRSIDPRQGLDMTTSRRMLNDQEFRFKPLTYPSNKFDQYIGQLFPEGIIHGPLDAKDQFFELFHVLSCGLPAFMTRLGLLYHRFCLELALTTGRKVNTFNPDLLQKVYKNQFKLIEPALDEFRRGNIRAYEGKLESALKMLEKSDARKLG